MLYPYAGMRAPEERLGEVTSVKRRDNVSLELWDTDLTHKRGTSMRKGVFHGEVSLCEN